MILALRLMNMCVGMAGNSIFGILFLNIQYTDTI